MARHCRLTASLLAIIALAACASRSSNERSGHAMDAAAATAALAADTSIPPDAAGAAARLASSTRHGEWDMIPVGDSDSVRAWVVYPERSTRAPVVIVIHEIFGMSTWIRAVTDRLAADGYIAIAPDFLTGKREPKGGPDSIGVDSAVALIRTLDPAQITRRIAAAARWGTALPAALPRYGIIGFCWGGSASFSYATADPKLGASVVFYGTSPTAAELATVRAPVLGLYGQEDARVTATIAPADSVMRALGRTYEHVIFPGAGHGFLRAQDAHAGANRAAVAQAWPKAVAWFRRYLGT